MQIRNAFYKSGFELSQLSVECNFAIAFVLHCYAPWLDKNPTLLYQSIKSKTKTNRDLLSRVYYLRVLIVSLDYVSLL